MKYKILFRGGLEKHLQKGGNWRQVSAEEEVKLQGMCDKGLSQPRGELWSWDDPAELSQARVREVQAFALPHWSVAGTESTLEGGIALDEAVFFQ